MSKVRINDLARELEVKSRAILDVLDNVGVTEKKTHSSSLELDEAERVRAHFQRTRSGGSSSARAESASVKPKIDWSRVSKPGDVLKAIQQRKDEEAAPPPRPAPPVQAVPPRPAAPVASVPSSAGVAAPTVQKPAVSASPVVAAAPVT